MKRPICKVCNKLYCAVNYHRAGVVHYRSICDDCGRKKKNQRPRKSLWLRGGYEKKKNCDLCGFHSALNSQITIFHVDGNLENINPSNLRSICLNCVEIIKKREVTWKRGDLEIDY